MATTQATTANALELMSLGGKLLAQSESLFSLESIITGNQDFYAILDCLDALSVETVAVKLSALTAAQIKLAEDLCRTPDEDAPAAQPIVRVPCETPESFLTRALATDQIHLHYRITYPCEWECDEPGIRAIILDPKLTNEERVIALLALPFRADLQISGVVFDGPGHPEFVDQRFALSTCPVERRNSLIIDQCNRGSVVAAFRLMTTAFNLVDAVRQMNGNPALVSLTVDAQGRPRYSVAIDGFDDARL